MFNKEKRIPLAKMDHQRMASEMHGADSMHASGTWSKISSTFPKGDISFKKCARIP
jgi:hypothetical protein